MLVQSISQREQDYRELQAAAERSQAGGKPAAAGTSQQEAYRERQAAAQRAQAVNKAQQPDASLKRASFPPGRL